MAALTAAKLVDTMAALKEVSLAVQRDPLKVETRADLWVG
jgi:hypothetical protein